MESKPQKLIRIDVWLVEQGLAPSRAKAQELLDEGAVFLRGQPVRAASMKVAKDETGIEVRAGDVLKYVSRGGRKLESALAQLSLDVAGFHVLDVGQSTGGFTDCVLQHGARAVTGVDVGSAQLDPRLRADPRVRSFEQLHLKDLAAHPEFQGRRFDLTVIDLSFISSLGHLPQLVAWSPRLLLLVKPQFELGPEALNKKGLVQKPELISDLRARFETRVRELGGRMRAWMASGLPGKDGNQEYFLYATFE